jgi:hypothetical protein
LIAQIQSSVAQQLEVGVVKVLGTLIGVNAHRANIKGMHRNGSVQVARQTRPCRIAASPNGTPNSKVGIGFCSTVVADFHLRGARCNKRQRKESQVLFVGKKSVILVGHRRANKLPDRVR